MERREKKKKKCKGKRKVEQGRAKKIGICTKCKREMGKNNLKKNEKQLNKKISSMNVLDSFQI
jgi:hypothetical protein